MINSNYNNYQNVAIPDNFYTNPYDSRMLDISQNYAEGGMVEDRPRKEKKEKNNPYLSLAEMIRQQGKGEDTILAHINPLEAMMLKEMGGSGKINPITGLPQFGFLRNPLKALKSIVGGVGGSIIGNMIMPGVGGIVGGALGNAIGEKVRGRKNVGQAALKGGLMGLALPSASSLAGSGANALGMNSAGNFLSDYGTKNAIMPSLSNMMGGNASISPTNLIGQNSGSVDEIAKKGDKSWFSSLMKPKNLLTAATVAGSFMNRPKEKSPERLADEQKRFNKALIKTPEERAMYEADLLAEEQMKRRLGRNKYLPEEKFEVKPLYRTVNSPEEYARTGRWLNYYDNPQMQGSPLFMKKGGMVPQNSFEMEEMEYPSGLGFYLQGHGGGQNDKVNARLSHGEFIMPADVVADIGDGNSEAGADAFYNLIEKVRSHKGRKNKLPPKAKSLASYMKK